MWLRCGEEACGRGVGSLGGGILQRRHSQRWHHVGVMKLDVFSTVLMKGGSANSAGQSQIRIFPEEGALATRLLGLRSFARLAF